MKPIHSAEQADTYRNTLRYALAIAGDETVLALRLKVAVARLRSWLEGFEVIPDAAFLEAVDVIVSASPSDIARIREALRRPEAQGDQAALGG